MTEQVRQKEVKMTQLRLKSTLTQGWDYSSIDIRSFAIPLRPDMDRYARDIKNFCKAFAKKEEALDVADQDMVTLSCSSENGKFQKEHITVRVGLGLYSRELESQLTGLSVGETKSLRVGKDLVEVTIEKSVREVIPELTDELAAKSGVPGIQTAEDARTWCRFKQYDEALEEAGDEAFAYLAGEVIKHSTFQLDEGELAVSVGIISKIMNLDSLESLKEEYEENNTPEQGLHISVEEIGKDTLMSAAYGQSMMQLTEEDYEAYLEKCATAQRVSVEEIRDRYPLTEYLINTYNDHFINTMEAYVFRRLKELGEAMAKDAE